jgi:hypothetical protein
LHVARSRTHAIHALIPQLSILNPSQDVGLIDVVVR